MGILKSGENLSLVANDMVCAIHFISHFKIICMFNVQVHIDKESEGGPSSANPVKLAWRQGGPASKHITQSSGTVVVHERTAYFSVEYSVYSYTLSADKWTKLPGCKSRLCGLAVVKGKLTTIGGIIVNATIGGIIVNDPTNSLFSLSGSSWKEVLPPMPTERFRPASASTPTHLVVAGGTRWFYSAGNLSTVEVLSQETLQWSTASSLPVDVPSPQQTLCRGSFYLLNYNSLYSCSVEDLLKSCEPATNSSDGGSVWTQLSAVPVRFNSSLVTLRGRVLAIGGADDPFDNSTTGAIHCYNATTNSWSVIGEMPTPRSEVLAAALPSNDLVVVGGKPSDLEYCSITDIGSCL